MKIYNNIQELVGNTPLVKLNKIGKDLPARILAKLEYFNPGLSVKDRVAFALLDDAVEKGLINHTSVIVEATSGNTGIGLALACAVKNYRLIITMPESMSVERRKIMKAYGAEIVLTPALLGMKGAIETAEQIAIEHQRSFISHQFENSANPQVHRDTTAKEIWEDTDGKVDIIVAGVGTGGTITGVSEELKVKNANLITVAVEPLDSAVLSGEASGIHKIQGIGAGFIPPILNVKIIDEILKISNEDAIGMMKELAVKEGLLLGISSGAAVCAACEIASLQENKGKTVVVILPDTGTRYLSD